MIAQTLWAAALLPLALAAPSPAPASREPLASGLHFRSTALDPVDADQATFRGVYGGSAEDATFIYDVVNPGEPPRQAASSAEEWSLVWIGHAGVEGLSDDAVARGFKDLELESLTSRIETYQQSLVGATYASSDAAAGQSPLGTEAGAGLGGGQMALEILTELSGSVVGKTSAVMAHVSPALLPVLDLFLPSFLVPVVVPREGYPSQLDGVPKDRIDYLEAM